MEPNDAPPPYSPPESTQNLNRQQSHTQLPISSNHPLPPLPPQLPQREGKQPMSFGQYNNASSSNLHFRHSDYDRNSSPNISHVDMEGNILRSATSPDLGYYSRYSNPVGESSGGNSSSSSSSPTTFDSIRRSSLMNRSNSMNIPIIADNILNREATSTSADLDYCHDERKVQEFNKNNSKLFIKQSNSPLELKLSWTGAECQLKNSNGDIMIHGSLNANKSIHLESNKGDITIAGRMLATKDIHVKAINGIFDARGESIIAKSVHIEHSNRPINLKSIIEAKKITIRTTNAPIKVSNISVGGQLNVKTTNAAIEVFINDIGSTTVKMFIESTNAPVNVYVPNKYSGSFNLRSNNGLVTVVSKFADVSKSVVTYNTNEDSKKTGNCKNSWNTGKCSVNIKTTNAPATLYIQ